MQQLSCIVNFEKNQQMTKNLEKFPGMQSIKLDLESGLLDILIVFLKEFFTNLIFENNNNNRRQVNCECFHVTTKNHEQGRSQRLYHVEAHKK